MDKKGPLRVTLVKTDTKATSKATPKANLIRACITMTLTLIRTSWHKISDFWKTYSASDIAALTLKVGLFKFSLLVALPVILLVAGSKNAGFQQEATQKYIMELMRKQAEIADGNYTVAPKSSIQPNADCYRYDPSFFPDEPSIVTYFPDGRLGNGLSSYLMMLWVKLDHGLETYMQREAIDMLSQYFVYANTTHKVLEEDLCDWRAFGFQKYEGDVELLGNSVWSTGKAIQIFISRDNYMRLEIQGGRKYYRNFRKQSNKALTFHDKFSRHAELTLSNLAKKVIQTYLNRYFEQLFLFFILSNCLYK